MEPRLPEDCLARFEPVRLVATGGFGAVFEAVQTGLGRTVALKVLLTERLESGEEVERFAQEARVAAAVSHPNVVRVFDQGAATGTPWIAYEWVPGRTLRAVAASGELDAARAVQAVIEVAKGLEAAHSQGILHRDLKPENVLEAGPSWYKLADFGIAKWRASQALKTRTGMLMGTPTYMAPEYIDGAPPTERSDLYALGIVLFELLAGHPPFEGSNLFALLDAHRARIAPRLALLAPGTPPHVDEAVARLLSKRPEERHASAGELIEHLSSDRRVSRTAKYQTAVVDAAAGRRTRRELPTLALPAAGPSRRRFGPVVACVTVFALGLGVAVVVRPSRNVASLVTRSATPGAGPAVTPVTVPGGSPAPDASALAAWSREFLELQLSVMDTQREVKEVRKANYGLIPPGDLPRLRRKVRLNTARLRRAATDLDGRESLGAAWLELVEPVRATLESMEILWISVDRLDADVRLDLELLEKVVAADVPGIQRTCLRHCLEGPLAALRRPSLTAHEIAARGYSRAAALLWNVVKGPGPADPRTIRAMLSFFREAAWRWGRCLDWADTKDRKRVASDRAAQAGALREILRVGDRSLEALKEGRPEDLNRWRAVREAMRLLLDLTGDKDCSIEELRHAYRLLAKACPLYDPSPFLAADQDPLVARFVRSQSLSVNARHLRGQAAEVGVTLDCGPAAR